MPDSTRIDRRQFAGSFVAASGFVTAALVGSISSASDDKPPAEPKNDAKPKNDPEKPAAPSEELLLLTYLTQRYHTEHFDDAAIRGIYGDLRGDLARGRTLSEFPLKNSDGPSFVFRAYRNPE